MGAKKHRHLLVIADQDWAEIRLKSAKVNKSISELNREAWNLYFNSNVEGSFHKRYLARLDYESLEKHILIIAKKEFWTDEELSSTLAQLKEKKRL